jgi:hypothetical protein
MERQQNLGGAYDQKNSIVNISRFVCGYWASQRAEQWHNARIVRGFECGGWCPDVLSGQFIKKRFNEQQFQQLWRDQH